MMLAAGATFSLVVIHISQIKHYICYSLHILPQERSKRLIGLHIYNTLIAALELLLAASGPPPTFNDGACEFLEGPATCAATAEEEAMEPWIGRRQDEGHIHMCICMAGIIMKQSSLVLNSRQLSRLLELERIPLGMARYALAGKGRC